MRPRGLYNTTPGIRHGECILPVVHARIVMPGLAVSGLAALNQASLVLTPDARRFSRFTGGSEARLRLMADACDCTRCAHWIATGSFARLSPCSGANDMYRQASYQTPSRCLGTLPEPLMSASTSATNKIVISSTRYLVRSVKCRLARRHTRAFLYPVIQTCRAYRCRVSIIFT